MEWKNSIKKFILVFLLAENFILTMQQNFCTLPDGKRQTCVRFHHCDELQNIFRQYLPLYPPPHVVEHIKSKYDCGNGLFCCPENAKFVQTSTVPPDESTNEHKTCLLPDKKTRSTCLRLHHCNGLYDIIRQYNGTPPQYVVEDIMAHATCEDRKYICCPDNASTVPPGKLETSTTTPTYEQSCLLPDNKTQSTCVKIHRCDRLNNIIKQYNQKPPPYVVEQINKSYDCGNGLFCCPNNDIDIPREHPNFELINEKTCGISTGDRIVGGVNAGVNEFPWAVLLGYQEKTSFKWKCGGSLISRRFVLTAAHCVKDDLKTARLGEHTISTPTDCDEDNNNNNKYNVCADPVQDIKIERAIMHPAYSSRYKKLSKNDIALLELESLADITKNNVRTICFPTNEGNAFEAVKSLPFFVTGWGRIEGGFSADALQKANVFYIEHNECARIFPKLEVYHTHICAGGKSSNKTDVCEGDSGGGLSTFASVNGRPRMVLYGVVSGGLECKHVFYNYPGFYMNIKYYLDWILDNMSH